MVTHASLVPNFPVSPSKYSEKNTEPTCDTNSASYRRESKSAPSGALVVTDVFYADNLTTCELSLLNEATEKGQAFRLKQLEGRVILLTCIGTDTSKIEVYKHLANRGIKFVVLENPNNILAQTMLDDGIIIGYIEADLTARSSLIQDTVRAVVNYFSNDKSLSLSGILTFWDDAVALNARLCEVFGVPGNPVHSIDVAHDKAASRKFFRDLGYPSPMSSIVSQESELAVATAALTFPCILKPLYGAASIGVQKVDKREELNSKYRDVIAQLGKAHEDGELMGLLFDDAESVGNVKGDLSKICVEEFLEGPEFDCDIVVKDGVVTYCNLIDDWDFIEPHFCEIGSSCPSARPEHITNEVSNFGQRALQELNITGGVFHVEVIHNPRLGPVLVECNPRMGGGPVREIHKNVYGVDLVDEACLIACGIPSAPVVTYSDKTAITVDIHCARSGILEGNLCDVFAEYTKDDPSVVSYAACGNQGDHLTGWFDGYPNHLGYLNMLCDIPAPEAIKKSLLLREKVQAAVENITAPCSL